VDGIARRSDGCQRTSLHQGVEHAGSVDVVSELGELQRRVLPLSAELPDGRARLGSELDDANCRGCKLHEYWWSCYCVWTSFFSLLEPGWGEMGKGEGQIISARSMNEIEMSSPSRVNVFAAWI